MVTNTLEIDRNLAARLGRGAAPLYKPEAAIRLIELAAEMCRILRAQHPTNTWRPDDQDVARIQRHESFFAAARLVHREAYAIYSELAKGCV